MPDPAKKLHDNAKDLLNSSGASGSLGGSNSAAVPTAIASINTILTQKMSDATRSEWLQLREYLARNGNNIELS